MLLRHFPPSLNQPANSASSGQKRSHVKLRVANGDEGQKEEELVNSEEKRERKRKPGERRKEEEKKRQKEVKGREEGRGKGKLGEYPSVSKAC